MSILVVAPDTQKFTFYVLWWGEHSPLPLRQRCQLSRWRRTPCNSSSMSGVGLATAQAPESAASTVALVMPGTHAEGRDGFGWDELLGCASDILLSN